MSVCLSVFVCRSHCFKSIILSRQMPFASSKWLPGDPNGSMSSLNLIFNNSIEGSIDFSNYAQLSCQKGVRLEGSPVILTFPKEKNQYDTKGWKSWFSAKLTDHCIHIHITFLMIYWVKTKKIDSTFFWFDTPALFCARRADMIGLRQESPLVIAKKLLGCQCAKKLKN